MYRLTRNLNEAKEELTGFLPIHSYWLHPRGLQVLAFSGADHEDSGRQELLQLGVDTSKLNYDQVYQEMFKRGYARIVELSDAIEVDIPPDQMLTKAQRHALAWRAADSGKTAQIRGRPLFESRRSAHA